MIMRALCALALFLAGSVGAFALDQASIPSKFPIPFANAAGGTYIRAIPQASQIGIQNGAASLTDGFPPLTFTPPSAGGVPPFGSDFNGVLKQITQWSRWQAAGATVTYDSGFSASIGGYPKNAILANASLTGCFWISTIDNNASNPDTGGGNWTPSCPGGGLGGTSTGSANAQTFTTTPLLVQASVPGPTVTFIAGFSNTGPLKVTVNGTGPTNVFRRSQLGATMSVGGEVFAGQTVTLQWDGTEWQCSSCGIVLVGKSEDYMGSGALPAGKSFEDGSCVSQSTFADLFAVIGTNYGTCSAGNFALPDARGNAFVGLDNQGSNGNAGRLSLCGNDTTLGALCGAQARTILVANLPLYNLGVSGIIVSSTAVVTVGSTVCNSGAGPCGATGNAAFSTVGLTTGTLSTNPGVSVVVTSTASGGVASSGGSGTSLITTNPVQFIRKIIQL